MATVFVNNKIAWAEINHFKLIPITKYYAKIYKMYKIPGSNLRIYKKYNARKSDKMTHAMLATIIKNNHYIIYSWVWSV
jgi:phosphoribosylaminoimidazole carboxylase (NCAIR synthetase)